MVKVTPRAPIVMVDDNPGDLFLAETCFRESKLDNAWLSFSNGPAFIAHLKDVQGGTAPMPSLVLLDINMPGMGGLVVLETVRSNPFFAELPVFCMLTSSSDPRDGARAQELGASGFWTKPDDPDDYIELFNRMK